MTLQVDSQNPVKKICCIGAGYVGGPTQVSFLFLVFGSFLLLYRASSIFPVSPKSICCPFWFKKIDAPWLPWNAQIFKSRFAIFRNRALPPGIPTSCPFMNLVWMKLFSSVAIATCFSRPMWIRPFKRLILFLCRWIRPRKSLEWARAWLRTWSMIAYSYFLVTHS